MSLKKNGIPPMRNATESIWFDQADITALMRLTPPDDEWGWRVVAEYPSPEKTRDKRYRAAHARSQAIRAGRVKYLSDLGVWEARAVLRCPARQQPRTLLYLRYCGPDGTRWLTDSEIEMGVSGGQAS